MMCLLIIHVIGFAISVYVYYFGVKRVGKKQFKYNFSYLVDILSAFGGVR
jgi:hypothetical protein